MILNYLLRKEATQILRNSFLPKLIFVYPILVICVMPWVMSMEVKNIKVDVVDADRSATSRRLVDRIGASNYFVFNGQRQSFREAMDDIERGAADVIVSVPQGYECDLVRGSHPQILLTANAANSTKGAMGVAYLTQMVTAHVSSPAGDRQLELSVLDLYNRHLDYKLFMIPALIGILLMMLCGFLPALNIVGEKESGTIEQINATPVSKWEFILAKLIPYWIIGLLVVTLSLILAWVVYGITCQGSLFTLYLLSALMAFMFSGIGLCVSNYSDTMQQATFVMWFIVVVMLLMSGMFTPVASMPAWAQHLVAFNPMRYFTDAIRTVFIRGAGFDGVSTQTAILSLFTLVTNGWAVYSYRKNH